jgi:D-alanyl-D-alanine carboxypeptidase
LLISCAACGAAYKPFQAALEDKAGAFDISAVNAALISNGEKKWESQSGEHAKKDSLYCIGSISKSFLAVLALILEEEGTIALDDTVNAFLPDLDLGNRENVTLRDLLTMRSGIADYMDDFDTGDYFKEYSEKNLILKGLSNSVFSTQGDFLYANTNILIAQQAIEKAAGKDCEELIEEKILDPLGLDNTFFAGEKESIKDRLVPGFSITKAAQHVDFTDTTTSWAGLACGMYSTAEDMARWADALQNSSLLSDAARAQLFDFMPVQNTMDYGLCIIRERAEDKEIVIMKGNVPGYSSVIYLYDGLSIVVLCNLSDYSGTDLSYAEQIADSILAATEDLQY